MKKQEILLPETQQQIFYELSENIRFTRLQKKWNVRQVAEMAGISRPTLWKIEKGHYGVAIGSYVRVLYVLGLKMFLKNFNLKESINKKPQKKKILMPEISL